MDYLQFSQDYLDEYQVNGTLLDHSRISQIHRARLYSWLSEQCSKQKFSRYTYALTCYYLDKYFMNRNQVTLKQYQLLALGALVLASKQVQIEGKIPFIDLGLFPLDLILKMQKNIAFGLNFFLNPPNYIDLLNNIAKMWDIKCEKGQIDSTVRYFRENSESYIRLKTLYETLDCINLFKKILDFKIGDVVLTIFYFQTKKFSLEGRQQIINQQRRENLFWQEDQSKKDQFQLLFENFLDLSEIRGKPNITLQRMLIIFDQDNYPISEQTTANGRTFSELVSCHTHNRNCYRFFERHRQRIQRF